jgi:hypothetical protein
MKREAPDSGTLSNECPTINNYGGEAPDSGTLPNKCLIISDYKGEAPDSGILSNECPVGDNCVNQEDWSTYVNLPPDLDLSAQSASPLSTPPPLLHSARTATPDIGMISTQICKQDSSTQSASYVFNAINVNNSRPESYLELLFLSSPLVLPPCLHLV